MSDSPKLGEPNTLASQEPLNTNDIKAAAGEQESIQDKAKKLEEELQVTTPYDAVTPGSSTLGEPSTLATQEPVITDDIKLTAGEHESIQDRVKKLEEEIQMQTEEKENYKNRLQATEKELTNLKTKIARRMTNNVQSEHTLLGKLREDNNSLQDGLNKAAELIQDKTNLCLSQERQNMALTNQVASLKEIISITKDLLNIRNMEVHQLQKDIESMECNIKMERERQNATISKMDEAVKLNAELKCEYENQLKIFQDLKAHYEEKIILLVEENVKYKIANAKTETVSNNESKPTEEECEGKSEEFEVLNLPDNKSREKRIIKRSDSTNSDEFVDAHEEIVGN